ncbi:monooxygenase [Streptomyces albus subsp. chlorinus]|uniref:FAD-dependent monooxygenase n=1 Tax=Streptomyces albus TaxID=1888 RepID=UPI00156EC5EF|nr:FAD-dependent monooxygenase [Streptomyces albus]NSC21544.1 monooxygenase [Streptomyces albus subsp. chlorinus]
MAPSHTAAPRGTEYTPVLIVGGGLAGLSLSLFLSQHGIANLLLERHATTSTHPRARGVNVRTMEILRAAGLEETVRATESARALRENHGIVAAHDLAGREFGRMDGAHMADPRPEAWRDVSPTHWALCDQDELEPLIAGRARALGSRLLFGHELVSLEGTVATVRDLRTGAVFRTDTTYVAAADGARSPLRTARSIPMEGPGALAHFANIYFHADLTAPLGDRRFVMCYLRQDDFQGALLPIDNHRRWLLHVPIGPDWEREKLRFSPGACAELVRKATGVPTVEPDIRGVLPWESAARVARRWREGDVFLVGDAAHVMPPTGAFGSNTGIQDAHNLAWKLAAVLRGEAGPALLDTYEAERRPVAAATVEQAVLRSRDRGRKSDEAQPGEALASDAAVMLGYRYRSAAVLPEGDAFPDGAAAPAGGAEAAEPGREGTGAAPGDIIRPVEEIAGLPGTRAPHVPLPGGLSLLDRYGAEYVLVTSDTRWLRAASEGNGTGVRLRVCHLPADEETAKEFHLRYGVQLDGAVLVRPDGFIGWRSTVAPSRPRTALSEALARLSAGGRPAAKARPAAEVRPAAEARPSAPGQPSAEGGRA